MPQILQTFPILMLLISSSCILCVKAFYYFYILHVGTLSDVILSSLRLMFWCNLRPGWYLQTIPRTSGSSPCGTSPDPRWRLGRCQRAFMSNKTRTQTLLSHCTSIPSPYQSDSGPLSPVLRALAATSAIIRYCKHGRWIRLCLTMSTGFNYWWMSRMSAGPTSFSLRAKPRSLCCVTSRSPPRCQSALINILHIQHLWSVFHCSSSGARWVLPLSKWTLVHLLKQCALPPTPHRPHACKNARPWPLTPGKKITWAQSGGSCLHPKTHHGTLVIASGGSIINNYFSPSRTVWSLWCIVFASEEVQTVINGGAVRSRKGCQVI